jgi:imidazole glycerol phosphate synthase subunit HisF
MYLPPFYIGLAVPLYHNFGSKQLIETLYSHGLCASYGEVRRYLTSIVHHEMEKRHDDVHVPDGIIPIREGRGLIQDGADNIDINTETIDGKNTFHSMARAVFLSTGIPLVFGFLKGTLAVNEEALSSSCTDLSCDIFIFF